PRLRRRPRPLPRGGRAAAGERLRPRKGRGRATRRRGPRGALIVRTSLLYGGVEPGPQEQLVGSGHADFFVDEIRSPVHVGDLAGALLELAEREETGPLHLGGADDVSRYDFALLLGADPNRIRPTRTTPERA